MLLNSTNLQGLFKSFRVLFNRAFSGTKPQYEKVATVVPSNTKVETYAWLGSFPRLRKWIGDRVINKLSAHGYTILNEPFEVTVAVNRDDIDDDTYGVYSPMMEEIGRSAAMWPDELVFELLRQGFEKKCYDGKSFFAADHQDGEGPVQSNTGAAPLSPISYGAARAAMMSLTDEAGKPLGILPTLLVVPPQLDDMGKKILTASLISETVGEQTNLVENIHKGSAELLVVPWLAQNPTAWFLLDGSRAIKPLIFQSRKKPEFIHLDSPTDENVFMRKEYLYGVDSRGNSGYGLWQLAFGSTGIGE